ncbi:MAG: tetratricopeptide repeat protein [Bdellovibrio sp.]|nr:tetratricopeptide repeat protein [Bdellovibrio sp.]
MAAEISGQVDQKTLSDEDVANLQVQRAVQRENLIQKSTLTKSGGIEKANGLYQSGLKSYVKGDYNGARKLFEAAILADPENDKIYFDYAKCLYRQNNFKSALSIFLMLENATGLENSAEFYSALSLYRLKAYKISLQKFNAIQKESNSDLAPSAAFYAGQIYYLQSKYVEAKSNFEFVLDQSKDPKMDAAAEKYIDLISQQERVQVKLDKKFGYSLNVGFIYDGNVLNVAEQNSTTSLKAYRLSYGGSAFYRAMNKANESWSPTFTFYDLYSVNTNFKSDTTIQGTDPMILEFSFPYSSNFLIGKKSSNLIISPAIQSIYMTKSSTSRELVFNNVLLSSTLSLGYSNYFTVAYKFDISREQSYITEASPNDEQTSQKYGLKVSSYYLLDRSTSETLILDLQYLIVNADGINSTFNKTYTAFGYARNLDSKWSLYAKAEYSVLNYGKSTLGRKDNIAAGYFGGNYAVGVNDTISLGLGYQTNQSNVDLYKYNKVIVSSAYTLNRY